MNWQSYSAIGIVAVTALIFLVRLVKPGKTRGCGHRCDCGKKRG